MSKKVAVIGSGISGMSSAWFLSQAHDVTLFEKNDYLGGHTHTIDLTLGNKVQPVDTGFIVYNEPNYPHLTAMLVHLGVDTQPTDMSFGVSINQGQLEYAGSNLNTLFAQRRNLLRLAHWQLLREIMRFNRQAKVDLDNGIDPDLSLDVYLKRYEFSTDLQMHYLLPMAAAIWSCPTSTMRLFPAASFLRFFHNHGLLNINERPQWQTVRGGSRQYLQAILDKQSFNVIESGIQAVELLETGVRLQDAHQQWHQFDEVIFACHADQARCLLPQAEFSLLDAFHYQENHTWVHHDANLMPKRRLAWSAWNYLSEDKGFEPTVAVTYWMNLLQHFDSPEPVLVSLNPPSPPQEDKVWQKMVYHHPVFDQAATRAQGQLSTLQGTRHCWFAGSYFGYGFHEDGLNSAVQLARLWQIALPWESTTK